MLLERIYGFVQSCPHKPAVTNGKDGLTYAQLWNAATQVSLHLRKQGNEAVLVYGDKQPKMLAAFLGCLLCGRPYLACDAGFPVARLKELAAISGASLILSTRPLDTSAFAIPAVQLDAFLAGAAPSPAPPVGAAANNTAYITFTSGSTGTPKEIPISVHNLEHFIKWFTGISAVRQAARGRVINQASFAFDLSVADTYGALACGGTLFVLESAIQKDYGALFAAFEQSDAAMLVCTPTFARLCLADASFNAKLLPQLELLVFCGEVLSPEIVSQLLARFPTLRILNAYGPAECTCAVCAVEIDEQTLLNNPVLPVGRLAGAAVNIAVWSKRRAPLPENSVGEIVLWGDSVASGYLGTNSPAFEEFQNKQLYHTGDLGWVQNGLVYCRGRTDHQIKWKGRRIEPGEIEARVEALYPGSTAMAAPLYKKGRVERLVLCLQGNAATTPAEIRASLGAVLPAHIVPAQVRFFPLLPQTANGKKDRKTLEAWLNNEEFG